jgi:hypothetical protein
LAIEITLWNMEFLSAITDMVKTLAGIRAVNNISHAVATTADQYGSCDFGCSPHFLRRDCDSMPVSVATSLGALLYRTNRSNILGDDRRNRIRRSIRHWSRHLSQVATLAANLLLPFIWR